jgi:predicted transcriptional regulator
MRIDPTKHDHAGMPMKIYKMKSFTKQITVEVIRQAIKKINNAIEEL